MTDKEQLMGMLERGRFKFYEEDGGAVYIKGRWGGVDFYFDKEGALTGGRVIGDECDLYIDKP